MDFIVHEICIIIWGKSVINGGGVEMKQYTCVTKASKIWESRQLILTLFVFQPILYIQGQFEGNKLNRRLGLPF